MLIALDLDGVVHPDGVGPFTADPSGGPLEFLRKHDAPPAPFCDLERLEGVLREFPWFDIVLGGAWKQLGLERLRGLFSPDVGQRIVGMTPEHPWGEWRPQREVRAFIRRRYGRRKELPWVAVDSDSAGFHPACSNLVICDPNVGFDTAAAERLRELLRKPPVDSMEEGFWVSDDLDALPTLFVARVALFAQAKQHRCRQELRDFFASRLLSETKLWMRSGAAYVRADDVPRFLRQEFQSFVIREGRRIHLVGERSICATRRDLEVFAVERALPFIRQRYYPNPEALHVRDPLKDERDLADAGFDGDARAELCEDPAT